MEILKINRSETAVIKLIGEPYQRQVDGHQIDATKILEDLSLNSDYQERIHQTISEQKENLQPLFAEGYYGIDRKLKKGESLSYEEAFSLMAFVSMGTNKIIHQELSPLIKIGDTTPETVFLQSISLLSAMSAKEGFVGLTPQEIAGMVAATLQLDTIIRIPNSEITIGIGGMGGDRGYKRNGDNSKLFSLSTMGSVVLSNFGPVHKHHSYPNTSRVAGQTAIEAFGARSDQNSLEQFLYLQNCGLLMSSCHTTRTIHTLSHRLKGETINHVIGPLAIPASAETPLSAFIGVNDNVHPETIIEALSILQKRGVQNYANSVAFCGLSTEQPRSELFNPEQYYQSPDAKKTVAIDEVAPPPYSTIVSFLKQGENAGTYIISPKDFLDDSHLNLLDFKALLIPNETEAIINANRSAIDSTDLPKAVYLSMTAALAIFTRDYLDLPNSLDTINRKVNPDLLHKAFIQALSSIASGEAVNKLENYVSASKQSVKI